jgi:methylenetetrahydrofolate reductase (NADPH)
MKISEVLKKHERGVCFEFFPPKTDSGKQALQEKIIALKKYNPLYASMTYGALGSTQEHTKAAVDILLGTGDLVVMPHLTCVGAQEGQIKQLLDEYKTKGVTNVMALRGDIPVGTPPNAVNRREFVFAGDLVKFIKKTNDFCCAAAVYPEGHIESPNLEKDLEYTKQKIDSGVDFAVTQMFFDNQYYYSFMERLRAKNINLPVLPGILPLTDIVKVKQFVAVCRTTIPQPIEFAMARYVDKPQEMEKVGLDFTIAQCRDLIKNGVKHLHFFTLNRKEVITTILDAL